MTASCHINGSPMVTMHEKSIGLNGALVILQDLLVATLGVVTTLMLITANNGKSTKSYQDGFICFSRWIIFGGGTLFGKMF
jgi:hypothetical protein